MSDRPLLDTGLFLMDFSRQATTGFLAGFEGDTFVKRFTADGSHAAYIVGHITFTDDTTLNMLAGEAHTLSEPEQKLFGGGATISETLADYPPQAELIEKMHAVRAKLVEYFKGLSPAELIAPVEGPLAQFGDTRAKLMTSIAWNECFNGGQMSFLRRHVSIQSVFDMLEMVRSAEDAR
ncbi:MAG: DinB family protein, partial [Planctomycetota bacterium]